MNQTAIDSGQIEKSVDEVQETVLGSVHALPGSEILGLEEALGRVLAQPLWSPIDVPAHDNSAMDGYAIRSADYEAGIRRFRIIGKSLAGQPADLAPEREEAVRVTTGAVMPRSCDTVVMQEICRVEGETLVLPEGQQTGQNRRLRGEDLMAGQIALEAGRILTPADLGLVASLGIAEVTVKPRLSVAIFSTGDELVPLGQALGPGEIYDSNRYTLRGMLTRLGCNIVDLGIIGDSPEDLEAAMRYAAANADVIISSGGVSVGEADYTKTVMARLGKVEFWRIAMRPGRPMAYGTVLNKPFFGLPGNPVAVMITFYFFARLPLLAMQGAKTPFLPLVKARLTTAIRKRAGRVEYQRAILTSAEAGQLEVRLTGQQGSGVLRSMSEANCFVIMDAKATSAETGDFVNCLPFHGLI